MTRFPFFPVLLFSALLILAGTSSLYGQRTSTTTDDVPRTISYQGMLTTANGAPIADGIYDVTITLYADQEGARPIWSETYRSHVTGGLFNLYLGDGGKPLPGPEALSTRLWIGTSVNGADEMHPLTPLASSPYALTVPNESITSAKLADRAVTADKVDMNYVAEVRINGEEISGRGSVLNITSGEDIDVRYDGTTGSVVIGSNPARRAADGDGEKGADVLDITDGNNNWRGRDAGVAQPFFGAAPLTYNTLAGGRSTTIGTNSDYATIAGGSTNTIGEGSDCGFIGGGCDNTIGDNALRGVIGGGSTNAIGDNTVGGAIGGGTANAINDGSDDNTIGGGAGNVINANSDNNTIGGGTTNVVAAAGFPVSWATIGGGRNNRVLSTGDYGIIGGGKDNTVNAAKGTIGGGESNDAAGDFSIIGGGMNNSIAAAGDYGVIGGGIDNSVTAAKGVIGGGEANDVQSASGAIAGGLDNTITASSGYGFIGSGRANLVESALSAIGGGFDNTIGSNATNSFIGGGDVNLIASGAQYATIGGGQLHKLEGSHGTIPGGDRLWVWPSYAQTAVGFYNAPRGAVAVHPAAGALTNDPLFMVGNGDVNALTRSNAFEVSYNGHSVVYDFNGSGGASGGPTSAIRGATYTDNIVYAWAQVDASGDVICDFGVASVTLIGPGVYEVVLNLVHPESGADIPLDCLSVTATVRGDECGICTVTPVAAGPPTMFNVNTFSVGGSCDPAERPFMFHVTGQPGN